MVRKTNWFKKTKLIVLLVLIGFVFFGTLNFLISIRFQISDYFNYVLFIDHIRFKPYKTEFQLLTKQMYLFVDEHPDFFREFTGECVFIEEGGLMFFRNGVGYPDNVYIHNFKEEGWTDAVNTYYQAFPEWFQIGHGSDHIYLNYIIFSSALSGGKLVNTRDGKYPNELIDSYWETNAFVYVKKVDRGWYEVILFQ
ncbi:MAG: hypothetical protein FWE59_02340 [Oscillospiraceae bacterium]|nr:hypothetical protein [Oscillospiraceae bacterium]